MKKFAKMSLVAAVAVAGTVASAQPLAEAIKNVDVSGTVVYRYNDYNNTVGSKDEHKTTNNYKIGLTAKAKVNDDVTAVTRFVITNDADNGLTELSTGAADGQVGVKLSNVYFSYTGIANTTVNVGKQGLTTPWTVAIDADSEEQTGTGILALTNVGPVTLAGAYFNQTNLNTSNAAIYRTGTKTTVGANVLDGSEDIATVGAMVNIGPVALDAWYLDMSEKFDSFTVGAKANFDLATAKLGLEVRHTALELDDAFAGETDNSLTKIILTGKMGIFNAKLGYAMTDKDGGLVALDNDAKTAYQTWNMNPNGKADADMYNVSFGVQALESLHVSANYSDMDSKEGTVKVDEKELYGQAVYQMSKNFSTYVRYGTYEVKEDGNKTLDDLRGRIQVQYSF